jgi:deazaflavin-dependent oxidoreductase (nitroreductase family)
MSTKPARSDSLKNRLSQVSEITITVTGRKSGRAISIPVWFVVEGNKLYLLPVQGSDTQWYKNVLSNPSIRIQAGGAEAELKGVPVTRNRSPPSPKNSEPNTAPPTLKSTTRNSTWPSPPTCSNGFRICR